MKMPFHSPFAHLLLWAALGLAGCASVSSAPMSGTVKQASDRLAWMAQNPKPLARPVLVLSGWGDPGLMPWRMGKRVRQVTGDGREAEADFFWDFTFPACRRKAVAAVEEKWPSNDPDETIEVDVIAHSTGGLVARYAALPAGTTGFPPGRMPQGKRLRIHALYTVGTPHRGAYCAWFLGMDQRMYDMAPHSDFLATLNAMPMAFPLVCYGVEGDFIVGLPNEAPPGKELHWVPWHPMLLPHTGATADPRIVADILRRLRGE